MFYLRYIWDDKKITIKLIYKKKIIDLVFLNFKCSVNAFRNKKNSARLAFQEIENLPP